MKFCAGCSQRLSEGAVRCPVCGRDAADAVSVQENPYDAEKYTHGASPRFGYKKPRMTYALILVNVIIFAVIRLFAYGGAEVSSLLTMHRGAVSEGEIYRIITSMFTHEEFFHLASNCYALYIYGMLLEPSVGKLRFSLVYFTGGILGNLLSFAFMQNPSLGASGAVFGLLGAVIAIHFINPTAMSRSMAMNVFFSVAVTTFYSIGGNINNLAHFGGLFGGYMMMCITLGLRIRKRAITSRRLMSVILVLLTLGSVFLGVTSEKSTTELCYGEYAKMCFYSGIDKWDKACFYADKITEKPENPYTADALAAKVIYFTYSGEGQKANECFEELKRVNEYIPIMNEAIYNNISGNQKTRTSLF